MGENDLNIPTKVKPKEWFWSDSFSKENRLKSALFIVAALAFFLGGLYLPKITYDDLCRTAPLDLEFGKTIDYKNPVQVFQSSLCDAQSNLEKLEVEFITYIFWVSLRFFFWYLAAVQMIFFLKKHKYFLMDVSMIAHSIFFWAIAIMIYFYVWSGW